MIFLGIVGAVSIVVAAYFLARFLFQRKKLLAILPRNKYRIVEYKDTNEYLLYTCLELEDWKYVHEYKTYQQALYGAAHHYSESQQNKKRPKRKRREKVVHSI